MLMRSSTSAPVLVPNIDFPPYFGCGGLVVDMCMDKMKTGTEARPGFAAGSPLSFYPGSQRARASDRSDRSYRQPLRPLGVSVSRGNPSLIADARTSFLKLQ